MPCTDKARRSISRAIIIALNIAGFAAIACPAGAVTTGSWNGYHWARKGPLAIKTVSRLSTSWAPYFKQALSGWSVASQIDLVGSTGSYNAACGAVYATIQVCNGNYGANGWLGYANVWTSGGYIVEGTVKLNDYYFSQARYKTAAWKSATICQEIGHTIGLAHNNTVRGDTNTGSCMDYTNDPDGGGTYGPSNVAPGKVDFAGLNIIYRNLDTTQLNSTLVADGDGYFIAGSHDHDHNTVSAVPDPESWVTLIAGFAVAGLSTRRQRSKPQESRIVD